jgi:hypothetical protein
MDSEAVSQDVSAQLRSGASALAQGQSSLAYAAFSAALAQSSATAVQYFVGYNLSKAGLNAELLALLQPYYHTSTATGELAVVVLNAAVATDDTSLVQWLLAPMPDPDNPLVAQATRAAQVALGTPTAETTASQPEPSSVHRFNTRWLAVGGALVLVCLVVGVLGVLLSGSSGNKQKYCGGLTTLVNTANIDYSHNRPASASQLRSLLGTLRSSAPGEISATTDQWATDAAQLAAAEQADGASGLTRDANTASDLMGQQRTMLAWGHLNCPSGSIPALSSASPTSTPTTAPAGSATTTPATSAACTQATSAVEQFIATNPKPPTGQSQADTALAATYQGLYQQLTASCPASVVAQVTTQFLHPWIEGASPPTT